MAIREIVVLTDPKLRKKTHKVTVFDKKFQVLVDDMVETMLVAPGVGLAAPQVGVSQRLITVQLPVPDPEDEESVEQFGEHAGELYVVANPKITKRSREMVDGVEGCLSVPGFMGEVERHEMVVVTGQDRHGKPFRIKAAGWLARVFQHEIDHLSGQLFIDIAKQVWEIEPEDEEEIIAEGE